jgi:hypothetical protein
VRLHVALKSIRNVEFGEREYWSNEGTIDWMIWTMEINLLEEASSDDCSADKRRDCESSSVFKRGA